MNYYNEIDEKTAAWLRELIKQGHLPPGDVDTRSIIEVKPNDLKHYTQCHFFAGIGGWSLALALAGWSPDTPVWTGSCPCQPFSTAGKGLGDKDERHLWPVFFDLIRQCRPEHVFGEQVASAIGKGWLDGVSADLESEGYACGAAVLGAHSVGAPHIRQRLYWVAHTRHLRGGNRPVASGKEHDAATGCCEGVDDSECAGLQGFSECGSSDTSDGLREGVGQPTSASGWSDHQTVACRDGKARRIPTEPAFFPLADGIPARVVRLRGYGNAIVPQTAAEFVSAYLETL
jgi:DNA (cytosine-5)-methyltransferase 1